MDSHGFVLTEAAQYAFKCQDVYPDILSFAAAIPEHLKPIFLLPVKMEAIVASESNYLIATRIAACAMDGSTPEGDLFSYQSFLYNDIEPTIPNSSPGSIFDISDADSLTHHQEYNFDQNIQVPTDTSYMSDVDMTQYFSYPYRTVEQPVRKSSLNSHHVALIRLALNPDYLETKTPRKIKKNADECTVILIDYDRKTRTFTFNVVCGSDKKVVKAALSDVRNVVLVCNCEFWRYNGPDYNAKTNKFLLGPPVGRATPPNIRDPKRQYWLCKHTYAVIVRLDDFLKDISSENLELDEKSLLNVVDREYDRLAEKTLVPLEDVEQDVEVDWEGFDGQQQIPVYFDEDEQQQTPVDMEQDQQDVIQLTQDDVQFLQQQQK